MLFFFLSIDMYATQKGVKNNSQQEGCKIVQHADTISKKLENVEYESRINRK